MGTPVADPPEGMVARPVTVVAVDRQGAPAAAEVELCLLQEECGAAAGPRVVGLPAREEGVEEGVEAAARSKPTLIAGRNEAAQGAAGKLEASRRFFSHPSAGSPL